MILIIACWFVSILTVLDVYYDRGITHCYKGPGPAESAVCNFIHCDTFLNEDKGFLCHLVKYPALASWQPPPAHHRRKLSRILCLGAFFARVPARRGSARDSARSWQIARRRAAAECWRYHFTRLAHTLAQLPGVGLQYSWKQRFTTFSQSRRRLLLVKSTLVLSHLRI